MFINSRQFIDPKQQIQQLMNNAALCIFKFKFQMVWIFRHLWEIILLKIYPEKIHTEATNWSVCNRNGASSSNIVPQFPHYISWWKGMCAYNYYITPKNVVKIMHISGKNLQIYKGFKNLLLVLQTIYTQGEESQWSSLNKSKNFEKNHNYLLKSLLFIIYLFIIYLFIYLYLSFVRAENQTFSLKIFIMPSRLGAPLTIIPPTYTPVSENSKKILLLSFRFQVWQ